MNTDVLTEAERHARGIVRLRWPGAEIETAPGPRGSTRYRVARPVTAAERAYTPGPMGVTGYHHTKGAAWLKAARAATGRA